MPAACPQGASSVGGVHSFETPIGPLLLSADDGYLSGVSFAASTSARSTEPLLLEAEAQLHAYFAGELERFELPLAARGTVFQRSVWEAVRDQPHGAARHVGSPVPRG